jgi:hypothetical protein
LHISCTKEESVIGGGNELVDALDESAIGGGNELVLVAPDEELSTILGSDDESVVALVDKSVTGGESIVTRVGKALASVNFFEAKKSFMSSRNFFPAFR